MKVNGRCHCGSISYEAEVDPAKVTICHCTDCQTLSGSAYRASVPAPAATFKLRGSPKTYIKTAESGTKRVHAFWGEAVTESNRGQGVSQALYGLSHYAYNNALSKAKVTMATLEFGAYDRETNRRAFQGDHWLHKYGDPLGPEAGPLRAAMRKQFYPDTDECEEDGQGDGTKHGSPEKSNGV